MAQLILGRVKGEPGEKGDTPVVEATASVSNTTGEPSVSVFKRETVDGAAFDFAFNNLKGEKGDSPLAFDFDGTTLTIVEK